MELIIIALIAGIGLGLSGLVPSCFSARLDKIITVTLFIMLFALGAQIGSNQDLLGNLTVLGGRAVVIAGFSVAGSLLLLWLIARLFRLESAQQEEHNG